MPRPHRAKLSLPLPLQLSGAAYDAREIIIAHDPYAGPLRAVRNVLIQSSLAELKTLGHYERYVALIDPSTLEQLQTSSLAPGWISVELAHEHYAACDRLALTRQQYEEMGSRVGDRVQDAVLISLAKRVREANFDLWLAIGSLHRMWPRVFQGGSVQVSKLGPSDKLIEERGYSLFRHEYYREAHLAVLHASFGALGVETDVRIASYNLATDELNVRVTWA